MNQGTWIALGIVFGTVFGLLLDNLAIGIGIGIALGAAWKGITAKFRGELPAADQPRDTRGNNGMER